MQADELDARARMAAKVRPLVRDLRHLGVPEARIKACRTPWELEDLRDRALAHLMGAPEPVRAA